MGKKKSKKFWFLQNRPSVRTPLHVSGCEMAHFNTSHSKVHTCIGQPWYGQFTALKKGILWPVSHDCIKGSGIQLMVFKVFRWLVFGFQLTSGFSSDFKRWNQFAFCLRQNLNYLRKKTSLESFTFGSWLNLYIIYDDFHTLIKATNRKHWINEQEIKTIKSADKKAVPENRQMMPEVPETTAERMEFMKLSPKLAWCVITKYILYRPVELYYHILGILNVIVLNYSTNVPKKSSLSSWILSTTPVLPTRMYWQPRSQGSLERGWDIDKLFQGNSKSVLIAPPPGGGNPGNSWWGCAARLSKSWPYFRSKTVIFHTRVQTRPLKSIPVFRPGL